MSRHKRLIYRDLPQRGNIGQSVSARVDAASRLILIAKMDQRHNLMVAYRAVSQPCIVITDQHNIIIK